MKRIQITHASRSCVVVSGHGSRDLVMKVMTRTPVFSTRSPRGWVMQPHRVQDLRAIAESRGYDVVEVEAHSELTDPAGGAW